MTGSQRRVLHKLAPYMLKFLRRRGHATSDEIAAAVGAHPRSVARAMTPLCATGEVLRTVQDSQVLWVSGDDGLVGVDTDPKLQMSHVWVAAGWWESPKKIPRTSVFDTRAFTEDT